MTVVGSGERKSERGSGVRGRKARAVERRRCGVAAIAFPEAPHTPAGTGCLAKYALSASGCTHSGWPCQRMAWAFMSVP